MKIYNKRPLTKLLTNFSALSRQELLDALRNELVTEDEIAIDDTRICVSGDGNDNTGNGSTIKPFRTLSKALSLIPTLEAATIKVGPGSYTPSSEGVASINWPPFVNLIGSAPSNTIIGVDINIAGDPSVGPVIMFDKLSVNGQITLNLTSAPFASLTFNTGAYRINRLDTNPAAIVLVSGAYFASTYRGVIRLLQGFCFEKQTFEDSSVAEISQVAFLGGTIEARGTASVRTVSCSNYVGGSIIDGVPSGMNTPTWVTDSASDGVYTGTLNKILLGASSGNTASRPTQPVVGQSYFDQTLVKPIWYTGAGWVDSDGAPV